MASGMCDCEETFLGRGYGVAEVEIGEKCRASRVGEALAELDVEEDMVRLLCVVGNARGEVDVVLESSGCRTSSRELRGR